VGQLSGFPLHKPESALRCSSSPDNKTALVSPMCDSREGDMSWEFNYMLCVSEITHSGALALAELGSKTD